jgi:hypothetical protein
MYQGLVDGHPRFYAAGPDAELECERSDYVARVASERRSFGEEAVSGAVSA